MVQSPFRYKKPPKGQPLSNGPNPKQRASIWIGGDAFVGEASVVGAFRSIWNPSRPKPPEKSEGDIESTRDDGTPESTTSSTHDEDENDANVSLPLKVVQVDNTKKQGRQTKLPAHAARIVSRYMSPPKLREPNKDDAGDVFYSPRPNDVHFNCGRMPPPDERHPAKARRQKSVYLGGR